MVKVEYLHSSISLPVVLRPFDSNVSLCSWAKEHREWIEDNLFKHGAILIRDFDLSTIADFENIVQSVATDVMEYCERSSPRHEVGGKIYTSTDYPPDQKIFPHNEHSYSQTFPMKLFFYCFKSARSGGETPIADCRKIYQRISPKIRERFTAKKWMYVRNFGDGFGLPWQEVFQTTEGKIVEEYCRKNLIEFEWRSGGRLRTRQVRPAIARHPFTGEMVWFNHLTFFHVSTLEPMVRDMFLSEFKDEDLPNNTYYGDGSSIEPEVLEELRESYLQEMKIFEWKRGDILILDNMLVAHSRNSFSGPRKILFAMADPYTRQDL